jgi:hypothetical protein
MALDWMKICKDTIDKPEIAFMAECMDVSENEIFGMFFRVYRWADSQTADGFVANLSMRSVARMSGVPEAFGHLLMSEPVSWAMETNGDHKGVQFLKWDRHNSKSAKRRALQMNRQQAHRTKDASRKKRDKSVTR